jgi:hypothetical protein
VKNSHDIIICFLGCSTLWSISSKAVCANSLPSLKISQINQDSSGVVGDTLETNLEKAKQAQLIDPLLIPQPVSVPRKTTPVPGSSIGVPTAYGAEWGDIFIGFSGAVTDEDVVDAAASAGLGFGDAQKSLGLEVGFGLASLFGDNAGAGLVGFKVHRALGKSTHIAAGWANAVKWDVATAGETVYGSLTHRFELQPGNQNNQLPLTITLGAGTGAYRSVGSLKNGENVPNAFASVGLRVIPRVSLITSWTGNQLNAGTSIAPFDVPLTVNLAATDITSNRGFDDRGSRTGFLFSTGYVFKF